MIFSVNSNKTSQGFRFPLVIALVLFLLAYLYWWLTRPAEKRLSAIEIETPSPTKAPPAVQPDDLTKIKGIGPKISETLCSQGVCSYCQIALMAEDDLRERLSGTGIIRLANLNTWPEQARLAALEEWEQLHELQVAI